MKNRKAWIISVGLLLPMVLFQNCSKISASDLPSVSDDSVIVGGTEVDEVARKCEDGTPRKVQYVVKFLEPAQSCQWAQNGNLTKKDEYFQARTEQQVSFDIPEGATVCDLKMNFEPQSFYFDDNVILTLNDRILATSYDWTEMFQVDAYNLMRYDWNQIKGVRWGGNNSNRQGIFCASENGMREHNPGSAECSWPDTQENGTIRMSFPKALIQKVVVATGNQTHNVFQFTTIGDNDSEYDCRHSAVQYDLEVSYVE